MSRGTEPRWPLAEWADRSPRVRWGAVIAFVLLMWGLAGGVAPPDLEPALEAASTATGGPR